MITIRNRRYGLKQGDAQAGATHLIKFGFDARKPDAAKKFPGKLPGALICRNTLGPDNNPLVDWDCMHHLGDYTPEKLARAKTKQLKSEEGLLPDILYFVLTQDAQHDSEGSWVFPSTIKEEYQCHDSLGLMCRGNGEDFSRRQKDGTRKAGASVPVGRDGFEASQFCEFSKRKECKARAVITLCLFVPGKDGAPHQFLSALLGREARFRLQTTGEYVAMQALSELERAANRLHGWLNNITGTLTYNITRTRTGDEKAPEGIVGRVVFALNETDIQQREQQIREQEEQLRRFRLEEQRVLQIAGPVLVTEESPVACQGIADGAVQDTLLDDLEPSQEDTDEFLHDSEPDLDPKPIDSEPQAEASGNDELELFGDLQADMATPDQLEEIKRLVAVTGASVEKIAAWGKVNFLRDLTQEQAEKAIETLLCRAEKMEGLS